MKKTFLTAIFLIPALCFSQITNSIFIGTNTGQQGVGKMIITIGNFSSDQKFNDSSINIDALYPFFQTKPGRKLLKYIRNHYQDKDRMEFIKNLSILIKLHYINKLEYFLYPFAPVDKFYTITPACDPMNYSYKTWLK